MTLGAGTPLGPYVIERLLGAGGMGEVYRARDTRLQRSVAVKILPPELSGNDERRERFQREAQLISSLSHPHICSLFDVGSQDGVHYLVMELLEGESLERRLDRGPLALGEILRFGREIASALELAHRQGIIHRDLKPGNIFLAPGGAKLLDFGLARALEPFAGEGLSSLPTRDKNLTGQGAILGTFCYMSPETLEGRQSDWRSDIFSLGVVLYQMSTARRPFDGESPASVIAAVLECDPEPVSSIVPSSPPRLDRLIRTCLARKPDDRWQSAHDLALALDLIVGAEQTPPAAGEQAKRPPLTAALVGGVLAGVAALGLVLWLWGGPAATERARVTASFAPPPDSHFNFVDDDGGPIALSPDGASMVFSASQEIGTAGLWLREMSSGKMTPLPETGGATFPFWSPDGSSVAFFADHKLKRFDLPAGPPLTLCDATAGRGGTWNRQGTILFSADFRGGLFRVDARGGRPEPVTELVEGAHFTHRWPQFLPDGDHFLYLAARHAAGPEKDAVFVDSLSQRSPRELLRTSSNVAFAVGHLFFVRGTELVAQAFDPKALELVGGAFPVAPDVRLDPSTWTAVFTVAQNGLLAYQARSEEGGNRLLWYDRSGKMLGSVGFTGAFWDLRLSPDERTLAATVGGFSDLWLFDLERQISSRFTSEMGEKASPAWSLDGRWLFYSYAPEAGGALTFRPYRKSVRGSDDSALFADLDDHFVEDFSPDGRWLAVVVGDYVKTSTDIVLMPAAGPPEPRPMLHSEALEAFPRFSPDSRWLAFTSDFSGRPEVYLTSVPGAEGRWQVSSSGGSNPVWRKDGRELYYLAPNGDLVAVEVDLRGEAPRIGAGTQLFRARPQRRSSPYDVADGGRRFLVNTVEPDLPVTLIVNWRPKPAAT